jgi:hypothetical protein
MQAHITFKYRPPGPTAGLPEQDMPTIYSRKANLEEVPEVGETVTLPTEELELPSSNTKERDGESEMGFKVVDRDYGSPTEITGGGDSTHYIILIVTNFDAS